jgi:hypothetical protein
MEPTCFSNNSFILILKSTGRLLNKNINITMAARDSKTMYKLCPTMA